jgi:hypothetical protein
MKSINNYYDLYLSVLPFQESLGDGIHFFSNKTSNYKGIEKVAD